MRVSEFQEIRYAVTDNVATLRLDRPRRNVWTGRTAAEYQWALHQRDPGAARRPWPADDDAE